MDTSGRQGRRQVALAVVVIASAIAAPAVAEARAPRPNVLLIVTDDQPAAGTMQVMPRTRALFERRGTKFADAVATTPTCCPSRATIMSGRYAHNHGVFHNRNNEAELEQLDKDSLLAHQLDRTGYRTGIVGKYLNAWPNSVAPPDFDRYAISQGPFFNTAWNVDGDSRQVAGYSTSFVRSQSRRFLKDWERRDRKPWFLYVAPFAPHGTLGPGGVTLEPEPRYADAPVGTLGSNPARAETSAAALLDKPPFWRDLVAGYVPGPGAPGPAETRAGQLRMLMSVDDMVEGIFAKLKKAKEKRRTLAIFVSDNGLFWGEHDGPPVKDMPYPEAVEVPMLMRWPGEVRQGKTDSRTAATVDLAPTILDAARVRRTTSMDGRSLLKPWSRGTVLLEYESSGPFPTWASLYEPGRREYTEYYLPNGQVAFREFYDLDSDPWLLDNLYGNADPADNPPIAPLATELAAARVCAATTCP